MNISSIPVTSPYVQSVARTENVAGAGAPGGPTSTGETVTFSEESLALARGLDSQTTGSTGSDAVRLTAAGQSSAGARSAPTYTVNLPLGNGGSLDVDFTNDIRISKTADGLWAVYFRDTDKTTIIANDGTQIQNDGDTAGDADSVYYSVSGQDLTLGNGDNTVYVYGDGAKITGGKGNDFFMLYGGSGIEITGGDGNDRVAGAANHLKLDLGEGSNSVTLGDMDGLTITGGNGNNELRLGQVNGLDVALGDGNNILVTGSLSGADSIRMGNGSNALDLKNMADEAAIKLGDGSNTVKLADMIGAASLEMGHGGNKVTAKLLRGTARIASGDGQNILELGNLDDAASVTLGKGDNQVTAEVLKDRASLQLGNGNNTISLAALSESASLIAGDGKNLVEVFSMRDTASVELGKGNNSFKGYEMRDRSSLTMTGGNNAISLYRSRDNARIDVGDGSTEANIYNLDGNSAFKAGEGANMLNVYSDSANAHITLGGAENTVISHEQLTAAVLDKEGGSTILSGTGRGGEADEAWTAWVEKRLAEKLPTTWVKPEPADNTDKTAAPSSLNAFSGVLPENWSSAVQSAAAMTREQQLLAGLGLLLPGA